MTASIAVVTHGGPLRYIFRELLDFGEISVGDCSYVQLSAKDGSYTILEMDGISAKPEC